MEGEPGRFYGDLLPGQRGESGRPGFRGLDGFPGGRGEDGFPGQPGAKGRVGKLVLIFTMGKTCPLYLLIPNPVDMLFFFICVYNSYFVEFVAYFTMRGEIKMSEWKGIHFKYF